MKRLSESNQNGNKIVNLGEPADPSDAVTKQYVDNSQVYMTIEDAYINGVLYIAHRGAPNIFPENTLEAFKGIHNAGARIIELDVYLLVDGTLGVMHDTTLTRTTTSTGNTVDQTAISWPSLVVDDGASLGGVWTSKTQTAPTLREVLEELGNKVVLCIEGKNTGSGVAIVSLLQEMNINPETVIVFSFILSELNAAVASGYHACALGDSLTPATVAAAGVTRAGVSSSASQAYITSLLAENIEVFVYTIDRHYERDIFLSYGVTGIISDDPIYQSEQHLLTTDPFGSQTWYHGLLANATDRGTFANGDEWGFVGTGAGVSTYFTHQGWGCPIDGDPDTDAFVINFKVNFSALPASSWASIFICDNTDEPFVDGVSGNGYHCLFRQNNNGRVQIYRVVNGSTTSIASQDGGGAITTGVDYSLRVTVTPSSIVLRSVTGSYETTANDTTYRGGYFSFGKQNNAACRFSDVVIT